MPEPHSSLPEHGRLACSKCFPGPTVWNETDLLVDGRHVVNNPMSGEPPPRASCCSAFRKGQRSATQSLRNLTMKCRSMASGRRSRGHSKGLACSDPPRPSTKRFQQPSRNAASAQWCDARWDCRRRMIRSSGRAPLSSVLPLCRSKAVGSLVARPRSFGHYRQAFASRFCFRTTTSTSRPASR